MRSRYRSVKSNYGVGLLKHLLVASPLPHPSATCPSSYFDYDLFLKKRWPLRKDYLYCDELWSLLAWLNAELGPRDAADLSDKRRFHDRASQGGLANHSHPRRIRWRNGAQTFALRPFGIGSFFQICRPMVWRWRLYLAVRRRWFLLRGRRLQPNAGRAL